MNTKEEVYKVFQREGKKWHDKIWIEKVRDRKNKKKIKAMKNVFRFIQNVGLSYYLHDK